MIEMQQKNTPDPELWQKRIVEIASKAAKSIADLIGTPEGAKHYDRGAGGDISNAIDLAAEKYIFEAFERLGEELVIVSEEIGEYFWNPGKSKRDFSFNRNDPQFESIPHIIIDPIDGSTNAARGIPLCAISIAVSIGPKFKNIIAGCIVHIATGDVYHAAKGKGAFKNDEKIECSDLTHLDRAIAAIAFKRLNVDEILSKLSISFLKSVDKLRMLGSCALDCALVARGALDVYVDLRGSLRSVDFAAGYLLINEAKGFIGTGEMQPLDDYDVFLSRRYSIVACASGLIEEVKKFYYKE